MSEADAQRWNKRYKEQQDTDILACEVLTRYACLLPGVKAAARERKAAALDLACGRGGNALLLAAAGFETHAWDISAVAISALDEHSKRSGLDLDAQIRDVVLNPPAAASFDVIVVSRYLERSLAPVLAAALRPGGLLYYQTFTTRTRSGPANPDYLLLDNELLRMFASLRVRAFEDFGDESFIVARNQPGAGPDMPISPPSKED